MQETKKFDFGSVVFSLILFLTPLLFLKGSIVYSYQIKVSFLALFTVVGLGYYIYRVWQARKLSLPKARNFWIFTLALFLLPLSAVISSLVSGHLGISMFGDQFEVGTAAFFLLMYLVFLFSLLSGLNSENSQKPLKIFSASSVVLVVYSLAIAAMFYGWLSPILGLPVTPAGNYFDLSIILSGFVLLALLLLNFGDQISKSKKIVLYVFSIISILLVGAIGLTSLELVLALFSLLLIFLLKKSGKSWKSFSLIFVSVVSLLFFISGHLPANYKYSNFLSANLSRVFKVSSFDVRPNLSTTINVAKMELATKPITGAGPNRFGQVWAKFKPVEINQSQFWNTSFSFGSGILPTLFSTLGILGILSLLIFLASYLYQGFHTIKRYLNGSNDSLSLIYFSISLFFWASMFFYTPGIAVETLTFLFTGLFAASIFKMSERREFDLNLKKPQIVFGLFSIISVLLFVSAGFVLAKRVQASYIANKAVDQANIDGDLEKAKTSLIKSIQIFPSDSYLRSLSQIYLAQIQQLVSNVNQSGKQPDATIIENFKNLASGAVNAANLAVSYDRENFLNYKNQASLYELLAQNGVSGSADIAKQSLFSAKNLNPYDPEIPLALGRLAAISGDTAGAKTLVNESIALKSNYANSYFTLAQLEAASNNVPATIKAVENAAMSDQSNAGLFFQLGLLKYQTGDFSGAVPAFENAIIIVPNYANAEYFLGLSYYKLGNLAKALDQFKALKITNPDNSEVQLILNNLEAGKDPFANAKPPVDNKPEKRKEPPIK